MQSLLRKRVNRFLQRNRFQAPELTFNPLLGLHPASDFGEQGVRELRFFNVLGARRRRTPPTTLGFQSRRRTAVNLMFTASNRFPEGRAERQKLGSFAATLLPRTDRFRQGIRPTLRRTAFLKGVYSPPLVFNTVGERRLRPRSNHPLLQTPANLAPRPKKWLSRWRQHLARVRRQRNLVKFLSDHLDPKVAKLRTVGRRRRPAKRFMVATNRGLQRHWRTNLRRPLWLYGGGFSHLYPEMSLDPALWRRSGWRSGASRDRVFLPRVATFGRHFFRRIRWLQRRLRFYNLPQQLRQMNFSAAALGRGATVPVVPRPTAEALRASRNFLEPGGALWDNTPDPWADGPALRRRLKLHLTLSHRNYNKVRNGLRDHPQLLRQQLRLELSMRVQELSAFHAKPGVKSPESRRQVAARLMSKVLKLPEIPHSHQYWRNVKRQTRSTGAHRAQRRRAHYRQRWVFPATALGLRHPRPRKSAAVASAATSYEQQSRDYLRHHPLSIMELQRLVQGLNTQPELWRRRKPLLQLYRGLEGHYPIMTGATLNFDNYQSALHRLGHFVAASAPWDPAGVCKPRRPTPIPRPLLPRPLERRLRRRGAGYGVYRYLAQVLKVTLPHHQRHWLEQLGSGASKPHLAAVRRRPGQLYGAHRLTTVAAYPYGGEPWLGPTISLGEHTPEGEPTTWGYDATSQLLRHYRAKGAALKVRRERLGERMLASYLHSETDGVRDMGGWPLLQNKRFCWSAWWFKPAEYAWVPLSGEQIAADLARKRDEARAATQARLASRVDLTDRSRASGPPALVPIVKVPLAAEGNGESAIETTTAFATTATDGGGPAAAPTTRGGALIPEATLEAVRAKSVASAAEQAARVAGDRSWRRQRRWNYKNPQDNPEDMKNKKPWQRHPLSWVKAAEAAQAARKAVVLQAVRRKFIPEARAALAHIPSHHRGHRVYALRPAETPTPQMPPLVPARLAAEVAEEFWEDNPEVSATPAAVDRAIEAAKEVAARDREEHLAHFTAIANRASKRPSAAPEEPKLTPQEAMLWDLLADPADRRRNQHRRVRRDRRFTLPTGTPRSYYEETNEIPDPDDFWLLTKRRITPPMVHRVLAEAEPFSGDPSVVGRLATDPRGPLMTSLGLRWSLAQPLPRYVAEALGLRGRPLRRRTIGFNRGSRTFARMYRTEFLRTLGTYWEKGKPKVWKQLVPYTFNHPHSYRWRRLNRRSAFFDRHRRRTVRWGPRYRTLVLGRIRRGKHVPPEALNRLYRLHSLGKNRRRRRVTVTTGEWRLRLRQLKHQQRRQRRHARALVWLNREFFQVYQDAVINWKTGAIRLRTHTRRVVLKRRRVRHYTRKRWLGRIMSAKLRRWGWHCASHGHR